MFNNELLKFLKIQQPGMRKRNELAARAEDRAWSRNISSLSLGSIGLC